MFHNCYSLIYFPILNWNITKVQDMSFIFHNFPLNLINFNWNISPSKNIFHMFTNFDNYSKTQKHINVFFTLDSIWKINIQAFEDVIDLLLKKANNIDIRNSTYIFNGISLNKSLNLRENGIENDDQIIVFNHYKG